jgi:hypothetical protein
MADRVPPANPSAELPEVQGRVRPLRPEELARAFAPQLTSVVDEIRQLYEEFAIRPYRVFLIHVLWTGGRRGAGQAIETSRRQVEPTPRVRDMNSTNEILRATGLSEEGSIVVDQISAKYAEDDLMGRTPDLQDPEVQRTSVANAEFFWEVQENRAGAPRAVRRCYKPTSVPFLSRDGFQWRVVLTKSDYDPHRADGQLTPRGAF